MNKSEQRAQKLKHHLQQHPKDYQSVISLFKIESDAIIYEQQQKKQLMMKKIANYQQGEENYGK